MNDQARIRTSRPRPVPAGGADCPEEWRAVMWAGGIDRSLEADLRALHKRSVLIGKLRHEISKVRQGGYWREVEWDQIMAVSLEGGIYRIDGRATNLRWTPR